MKKTIISIILAALMLVSAFTACTNPAEPVDDPTEPPATDAPATDIPATEGPTAQPTDTPEPALTFPPEEWLLDKAWEVYSRIAEVHGVKLDRSVYEINSSPEAFQAGITFYECERGAGLTGTIRAKRDRYGHIIGGDDPFEIPFSQMSFIFPEDWEQPADLYDEAREAELRAKFDAITVTPEDIAAYGCTATGGNELLEAVAACYAEKCTAFYTEADEGFHSKCYEAAVSSVELTNEEEGRSLIFIAVRPVDIFKFTLVRSLDYSINDGSTDERLFGWINIYGDVTFEQREDGSWIGILGESSFIGG